MNKSDKRLIEGVLGGLGFVGAQFAGKPSISIPIAFTSVFLSTTAIILDTWEADDKMGDNPPRLPFKMEEKKEDVLPRGPVLRFNLD